MEHAVTLPLSQVTPNTPYPKPDQFGPRIHFLKVHFNIILTSTPGFAKWSFPSLFLAKILYPRLLSPEHVTCSACPCEIYRNIVSFNGGDSLAPLPSPNLKDHPLSAVHDSLLNIFASALPIWKPLLQVEPGDASYCGDRRLHNTDNKITICSCRR